MNTANIEQTILRNLLTNEGYTRKVIPFIQKEYFEGVYQKLFEQVLSYTAKYNKLPTSEALQIEIDDKSNFTDEQYRHVVEIMPRLFDEEPVDETWLYNRTEKWCQDRALFNSIMESIKIIDGKHQKLTKDSLPDLLTKALGVTFDTNVGHDYLENIDERYAFYHAQEEKIPFDIELLNKITKGGLSNKSLNIALAGTGVGKSLFMCHIAANSLIQGKNVLYITLEMSEERIAERIDANLLDLPIDQIEHMSQEMFSNAVNRLKTKTNGRLIVKEYPTGTGNSNHFRALLNELKLKKAFEPDIIMIDYLNICASSRIKMSSEGNSYGYIKAIAEELRGLAVEFDLPIVSATQTTRKGFSNSDPGLEDTSESFGLPATADLMFALVTNEELEEEGNIMIKQLKNRYNDPSTYKRFLVGIDRSKMRLMDAEKQDLMKDTPTFDKTNQGEDQKKFEEWKF
jgi:replicative DNA helicase|tara:strand:+ start:930 stop:2300 length:1371 start_codon:yes stop_codon:yes gene_type:complete